MRVPFNYLPMQFNDTSKIFAGWKKLIKTSDFTFGQKMIEFEKKFAKFIGVKYCISTNNGTDALILSLKSLNIGKTDEVITVCNTFFATVKELSCVTTALSENKVEIASKVIINFIFFIISLNRSIVNLQIIFILQCKIL